MERSAIRESRILLRSMRATKLLRLEARLLYRGGPLDECPFDGIGLLERARQHRRRGAAHCGVRSVEHGDA